MSIKIKESKKGTLHTALGVKQGEKIPTSKLTIHKDDSPALKKKKQFAQNARKWNHEYGGLVNPYDLGGILQGAGALANFIPGVGNIVGAGLGIAGSLISGNKQRKEEAKAADIRLMNQKQQALSSLPISQNGVAGVVNPFQIMALGGLTNNQNKLETYNEGGTHEMNPNGGIPIGTGSNGKTNTVEEGESSFNFSDGKYVFSNRLSVDDSLDLPGSVKGKSYSDAAKHIENLFKGRNGAIDQSTKKNLMSRLRSSQEEMKQSIQVSNEMNEFAGGGLSRSEDYGSKSKPYPSVAKSDFAGGGRSYPIPTKADAVDALRLAGLHGRSDVKAKVYAKYPELKHEFGGLVNPYDIGGLLGNLTTTVQPLIESTSLPSMPQVNLTNDSNEGAGWNINKASGNTWWNRNKETIGTAGTLGLMAAPLISNEIALRNLQSPEKVTANVNTTELQPHLVNRQQIQRNLANQLSSNRMALQEASSGDFGQYAANLQALNQSSSNALANATLQADLADAQELGRVDQLNRQNNQYNAQLQMRADEINAQNLGAYNTQQALYQQARGENLANIGKTIWNYKQSEEYVDSMGKVMSFLGLNKYKPTQQGS